MLDCIAPAEFLASVVAIPPSYLSETPPKACIPVFLVGKQGLALEGLRTLLQRSNFDVKQTVARADGIEDIESVDDRRLVIIVDCVAGMNGTAEAIRSLRLRFEQACIVVLLGAGQRNIPLMLHPLGANAILDRNIDCNTLIKSLHLALAGYAVLSPPIEEHGREAPRRSDTEAPRPAGLSPREAEIAGCIAEGQSNKVIARRFSLSEATVKVHVRGILRKIEARNRTQAAVWALNKGFGTFALYRAD